MTEITEKVADCDRYNSADEPEKQDQACLSRSILKQWIRDRCIFNHPDIVSASESIGNLSVGTGFRSQISGATGGSYKASGHTRTDCEAIVPWKMGIFEPGGPTFPDLDFLSASSRKSQL